MINEEMSVQFIAEKIGANLFEYQQIEDFTASELQNMIFELSGKNRQMISREIWKGYIAKSEEYEN